MRPTFRPERVSPPGRMVRPCDAWRSIEASCASSQSAGQGRDETRAAAPRRRGPIARASTGRRRRLRRGRGRAPRVESRTHAPRRRSLVRAAESSSRCGSGAAISSAASLIRARRRSRSRLLSTRRSRRRSPAWGRIGCSVARMSREAISEPRHAPGRQGPRPARACVASSASGRLPGAPWSILLRVPPHRHVLRPRCGRGRNGRQWHRQRSR